jgi:hypothetical protein
LGSGLGSNGVVAGLARAESGLFAGLSASALFDEFNAFGDCWIAAMQGEGERPEGRWL